MNYYKGFVKERKDVVFVFGSNPLGINGNRHKGTGGAALQANLFGWCEQNEVMDNRLSNCGKSYGLVTVSGPGRKLSLTPQQIEDNVVKLYECADKHPNKWFCIAYKNYDKKSLNGLKGSELFDIFKRAIIKHKSLPSNILFSQEWVEGDGGLFEDNKCIIDFTKNED